MMVSCPGCNNMYSLDERKLSSRGALLTCAQCGKKWKVRPPSDTAMDSARTEPAPAPDAAEPTSPARLHSRAGPEPARPVEISQSMAGTVSCPSCGHAFVPAPRPSVTGTGPMPRISAPATGQRVLIIEDQNYFAELTRDALGKDFDTHVVATLSEARSALADGPFDLVILDLSLEEGQDGSQLLSAIRKRGTPVLVFTARDETEMYGDVWASLRQAGATDILIKGMNVGEELRQKVKSILAAPKS